MHFFSPANVMKLLEVVRGEKTAKDVLATVMQLGKKIKKTRVVSGVMRRLHRQPHDRAVLAPGRLPAGGGRDAAAGRQGDGEVRHRDGAVPHGRPRRQRRRLVHPQAPLRREARTCATRKTADLLCEMGRFGQKTGAGWYDYVPGKRDAIPSKVVTEMIEKHRAELGITPRKISDEEIVAAPRLRARQRGREDRRRGHRACARRDIDMVYLTGYGFPLHPRRPDELRRHSWGCSTSCRR